MSEIRGWVLDFICLFFIHVEVLSWQMVIQIWNLEKLPDCNKNCGNNNFHITFEALRLISLSREGVMTRKKRLNPGMLQSLEVKAEEPPKAIESGHIN